MPSTCCMFRMPSEKLNASASWRAPCVFLLAKAQAVSQLTAWCSCARLRRECCLFRAGPAKANPHLHLATSCVADPCQLGVRARDIFNILLGCDPGRLRADRGRPGAGGTRGTSTSPSARRSASPATSSSTTSPSRRAPRVPGPPHAQQVRDVHKYLHHGPHTLR